MSQLDKAACWLTGPLGAVHLVSATMTQTVNGGVQWSATAAYLLAYTWGENDVWQLHVRTGRGISYHSMGLQVVTASLGTGVGGNHSELSGVSVADFRLNTEGISAHTITDRAVVSLCRDVCTLVGIRAGTSGSGFMGFGDILEFDVQGGTVRSYLERALKDYGLAWRVGDTGDVEIIWPMAAENMASIPLTNKITTNLNESARWHQVVLKKESKAASEYRFQLDKYGFFEGDITGGLVASSVQFQDLSTVGGIGYVAGWDQPAHAGNMSYSYANTHYGFTWSAPTSGLNVVYSITGSLDPGSMGLSLKANGEIVIRGVPPGVGGYDPTFQVRYPDMDPPTGVRWRVQTLVSPLWQTEAIATACAQAVLWGMNNGVHVVSREVDFAPNLVPGKWFDSVRYDMVGWSCDVGKVSSTMSGWAPIG